MSKTMTVSELVHQLRTRGIAQALAESLVGVTIVPDPEKRPDFKSMPVTDIAQWIYANDNGDWGELRDRIVQHANIIADLKGLA